MESNKVIRRDHVVELLRTKRFEELTKELSTKTIVDHYDGQRCYTPLCAAILYGNPEIAELILAKGEPPNEKCFGGNPLWIAAYSHKFEFIPLLVRYGASHEASRIKGMSPMKACVTSVGLSALKNVDKFRVCATTQALLESGLPESFYQEPLLDSVDDDDQLIMLIEAGADLRGENTYGVPFYPDLARGYSESMRIRIDNAITLKSSLVYKLLESMRFIVDSDFTATKRVRRRCGSGPSRTKLIRIE